MIELAFNSAANRGGTGAVGLSDFLRHPSPYVFRRAVIRNNVISHFGTVQDNTAAAISVFSCENLIAENNVIDLQTPNPIQYSECANVEFFNNRSLAGKLIQGYNRVTTQNLTELAFVS